MGNEERRCFVRYSVRIPVGIYRKGEEMPTLGEILNISEGGAFVVTDLRLKIGEEITIESQSGELEAFESRVSSPAQELLPADDTDAEKSVVRWSEGARQRGLGVQFLKLGPKTKAYIQALAKKK